MPGSMVPVSTLRKDRRPCCASFRVLKSKTTGRSSSEEDLEGVTVDERHLAVVGGRGEVGGNVVHEGVHALLLHAGTGEHGDEQTMRDGLGEQALDLLLGEGLALEVLLHELVVGLSHEFAKRLMRGLGGSAVLLGISVSVCLVPSQ